MAEYYDKDKFTGSGGQPPETGNGNEKAAGDWTSQTQTPPEPGSMPYSYGPPPKSSNAYSQHSRQKKAGDTGESEAWWYSWPAIIILFAVGIWPVALMLLFYNLFAAKKPGNTTSAVERAIRKAEERTDAAADKTEEAIRRAAAQVEQSVSRAAKQVQNAGRSMPPQSNPNPQPKPKPQPRPAKLPKEKKKSKGTSMRIAGTSILALGGIVMLDFLSEVAGHGYVDFDNLFASLGFLAAGGMLLDRGMYLGRMSRRSQRYILAIGNTDAMPIDVIARRVNRKPKQAMKELQKLIDKGYMGEDAYIDYERGYFLRFGAALEEEPEPEPEPFEQAAPPVETEEGYSGVLRSIRRANDRIADPELSRKIDRLEQVTGLIFREVEEHPEKRERIRTFFDYYLPTTQKLLDAYADFEATGVEGEHLREAKERIEQTMDAIVDGFEHQLDQLYSSDAMDVVSDIKVMEAMLNRDTASAARDFGFEMPKDKEKGKNTDTDKKKDEGDFPRLQI